MRGWSIKRVIAIVMLVGLLFIGITGVFPAANGTVYNTTAMFEDFGAKVRYYGTTTTAATDSIGTHYTQAMWIGPLTANNAFYTMVMSNDAGGTEDCNVSLEYSLDRETWFLASLASGVIKDQLTTTAIYDTLNVQNGSSDPYYKIGLWMRLKFAYQAGNPIGTTLSWSVVFDKPALLFDKKIAMVRDKI